VATVGVDLAAAQDNLVALAGYHHVGGMSPEGRRGRRSSPA
jgi:hypothetical protein